jgi:hypothetical protein
MHVNAHLVFIGSVIEMPVQLFVIIKQGYKLIGVATNDGENNRKPGFGSAHHRFGRTPYCYPHGYLIIYCPWQNGLMA